MATTFLENAETLTDSVQLVDRILRAGMFLRASDVHFDPFETSVRVRFRIDGALQDVLTIPASMASAVTSRLKVLASLDIAERRAPQDGGFSWRMPGGGARTAPLDVRMATLPVRHGERITLRLLETGGRRLGIGELGMGGAERAAFDAVLRRPHGLVLLTGPTGSGKTTTLYAAISELLKGEPRNILTVEDPVEYEMPGLAQVEVDAVADKVNYSKALRSLLRHDPDVCVIGEIRDRESAEVAVRCALTGHLVFSTLHTNDARSARTRLVDLGIDPSLVDAVLRLVVAQRLVRKSGGGRIGVFEVWEPGAENVRTMLDDAREKVAAGVVTLEEVAKVLGD